MGIGYLLPIPIIFLKLFFFRRFFFSLKRKSGKKKCHQSGSPTPKNSTRWAGMSGSAN